MYTGTPASSTLSTMVSFQVPSAAQRKSALGSASDCSFRVRKCLEDIDSFWSVIAKPKSGDWLAEHKEAGQTFEQFKTSLRKVPTRVRHTIYILPLDTNISDDFLAYLHRYCTAFYHGLRVKILPKKAASSLGVPSRDNPHTGQFQWHAGEILQRMTQELPADAFSLIGILKDDIYPREEWNFVFGLASISKRVGVFSFARYDPGFLADVFGEDEGVPAEHVTELINYRSCRVMAHEIGHMFGLKHCIYYNCLMNGSNSNSESHRKPAYLCPVCLKKLQLSVGFDPIERYRALAGVMEGEAVWQPTRDFYVKRADHVSATLARLQRK